MIMIEQEPKLGDGIIHHFLAFVCGQPIYLSTI